MARGAARGLIPVPVAATGAAGRAVGASSLTKARATFSRRVGAEGALTPESSRTWSTAGAGSGGTERTIAPWLGGRGERGDGNGGSQQALDIPEKVAVGGMAEGDGPPGTSGPPGASDPVNIVLRRLGQIVVDDAGHRIDVESPGRHVGGNENPGLAGTKP